MIGKGELRFPYDQASGPITATKDAFTRDLAEVQRWMNWVNEQVATYNSSLESSVRGQIVARRADLTRTQGELSSLGFRVRAARPEPVTPVVDNTGPTKEVKRVTARAKARKTYDVALSFAGEDREYVAKVAEELKRLGLEVFYADDERVSLWGKDLAEQLADVYGKDARYVVLFLSKHHVAKAWPTHERRVALSRLLQGESGRILPVRFDNTEVPGLPTTIAFLDLRVLSPSKLAELIRQKVDHGE